MITLRRRRFSQDKFIELGIIVYLPFGLHNNELFGWVYILYNDFIPDFIAGLTYTLDAAHYDVVRVYATARFLQPLHRQASFANLDKIKTVRMMK